VSPADKPTVPAAIELAMRRTGMSFQRTRMAADRTLMAVIRTALSLITFGFTIYQVFKRLADTNILRATGSARHFGMALVFLGIGMLVLGIGYHVMFMLGLRKLRKRMKEVGDLHAESTFPTSLTLLVAIALLLIGIAAALSFTS
jgi:putative membrane protein